MHCELLHYLKDDNCVAGAKGCAMGKFEKLYILKVLGGKNSCAVLKTALVHSHQSPEVGASSQAVICRLIKFFTTTVMTNLAIMTAPPLDLELFTQHICAQLLQIIQPVTAS